LQPKWYSYDRAAKYKAVQSGDNSQWYAADKQPKYICDDRRRAAAILHILAKRGERQRRQFKALPPDRDSDDRYAPKKPCDTPRQSLPYPAANHPDKIPKASHYA